MIDINAIVSKNIKHFRKDKKFTQEVLAEKIGVSSIYISYLERGTKAPSLELLAKIADVLEIDPASLLIKDLEPKSLKVKKLTELLNSLDEPTIRFIDDIAHSVLELKNTYQ